MKRIKFINKKIKEYKTFCCMMLNNNKKKKTNIDDILLRSITYSVYSSGNISDNVKNSIEKERKELLSNGFNVIDFQDNGFYERSLTELFREKEILVNSLFTFVISSLSLIFSIISTIISLK